ncbi:hypothetical protein [Microtetraspora sp. NBRC 16547]|uniref:hypothetical protein n=1 Tax=Microtetraspora sp. NBRC 16547 TaxID=3030993 RepID=UPI00255748C8|nr:hypothetical protein [Microtetraspora sp. NBRC 16547]
MDAFGDRPRQRAALLGRQRRIDQVLHDLVAPQADGASLLGPPPALVFGFRLMGGAEDPECVVP